MSFDFTAGTTRRCRHALRYNDGHPLGVWSTGEQLAVALVLDDRGHLEAMGYTSLEAARRIADDIPVSTFGEFGAWLRGVRAELRDGDRGRG